jgi:hypothetical protein
MQLAKDKINWKRWKVHDLPERRLLRSEINEGFED